MSSQLKNELAQEQKKQKDILKTLSDAFQSRKVAQKTPEREKEEQFREKCEKEEQDKTKSEWE